MSLVALLELAACLAAASRILWQALPGQRALALTLSAALGLGLWSALYSAALFAGASPLAEYACALLLFAAARFAALRFAPAALAPPPAAPAPKWLQAALGVALLSSLAFALEHAFRFRDGGWDAWMIWNSRARFLYRAGDGWRAAFSPALAQAEFGTHGDYPLLLPGLVVQGFRLLGAESRAVPAAVGLVFGGLCAAIAGFTVRALCGGGWAAACTLLMVSTPALPVLAAGQCADVPLAAFFCAAASCALLALRAGERGARPLWLLCGAFLSLAAWDKNEGVLPLLALPAAIAWLCPAARRGLRWAALGALPLLALWGFFKLYVAPQGDLAPAALLSAPARALELQRWSTVLLAALRRLAYFQLWGVHLVAALAGSALLWRARARLADAKVPLLACALVLGGFFAAYLFTPHDLDWHIRTSIDRLLLQIWPTLLVGMCLGLCYRSRGSVPGGST